MPIYKYTCENCKEQFEYFHMTSKDKAECPKCKSKKVNKEFSAGGGSFKLKGKGWFKDGY